MKYIKNIAMLMIASFAMLLASSCTDDDTDSGVNDRLFRPVSISLVPNGTTLTAKWASIQGATGYTCELWTSDDAAVGESAEEDVSTGKKLVVRDENVPTNTWVVKNLKYDTSYWFRVKSIDALYGEDSYFSDFYSVKIPAKTPVLSCEVTDPVDGEVEFSWMAGFDVRQITVVHPDGRVQSIPVDDAWGSCVMSFPVEGTYTAYASDGKTDYNEVRFIIPVLYDVELDAITFDDITFCWRADNHIAALVCTNAADAADVREFVFDAETVSAGTLTLTTDQLAYDATYKAVLRYEEGYEKQTSNEITFRTMIEKPEGLILVSSSEELVAAVAAAAEGTVIALQVPKELDKNGAETKNDYVYHIKNTEGVYTDIVLPCGMTIMPATGKMPHIIFKQFSLKNAAEVQLFRIYGLEIEGYDEDDKNTSASYLIDQTTDAKAVTQRIEIEDCYIHGIANSLVRADRTKGLTVPNIVVNNNRMYTMNGKQCYISTYLQDNTVASAEITFTNNTITGLSAKNTNQRAIAYMADANTVVTVSNNTFYNCQNGTSPLFHARGSVDGSYGKVVMKSNIFYNKPSDYEDDGNGNITCSTPNQQPDFGEGAALDISGNVMPFKWYVSGKNPDWVWTDFSEYGTVAVDPKFNNASKNDFTVTDATVLKLRAGDPRWLK